MQLTTTGARSSSPFSSATPTARPPRTRIFFTRASVRISAPNDSAERRIASETPPMPPCWKPHEPRWPSPTSPIEWWSITYAVPGSSGPAHVPITPFTVSIALIASDSNQSSSRSVTLIVNRRVTSATPRVPSLRIFHADCALATRSPIASEPSFGGTCSSSGPRTSATPFSHASHFGSVSASFFENCAIES